MPHLLYMRYSSHSLEDQQLALGPDEGLKGSREWKKGRVKRE